MIRADTLASLSNDDLFVTVQRLTARSNVTLANLLAHLGEVERRGIHRLRACASLYSYCIFELRMSEDAAYRRSKAARLVREYPELHDAVAKGELHLTGVLMIGPHLGGERHAEILQRARFRSKRELLRLIAEIDPRPEVPALVEPLGPAPAGRATHGAFMQALAGPVRELPPGSRPADWITDSITDSPDSRAEDGTAVAPDSASENGLAERTDAGDAADADEHQRPLHYKVQFTANQEFVDLLVEAKALLGHETPRATLPEIQVRALRALVQQLRARKRATKVHPPVTAPERVADVAPATAPERVADVAPATAPERRGSRHIPAFVRRAVFERDGARCAYRDDRGERCRETVGLEIHHRHAHALGGPRTLDNLELRCRPHNTLAAEEDFGREHMDFARGVALDIRG
jgi:5-methylcytosine-specific restriction endonuclease McrA